MKLLVDTHLLLWAAQGIEHLPLDAQTLMSEPENELFFSIMLLTADKQMAKYSGPVKHV